MPQRPTTARGLDSQIKNVVFDSYDDLAPRFVDNESSDSFFVPQNTSDELRSFFDAKLKNLTIDYAIPSTTYMAYPQSYKACTFTPDYYLVNIPRNIPGVVEGYTRLEKEYISTPNVKKTDIGTEELGSVLSYTFKRMDCSTDLENNKKCNDVTFIQAQKIVFSAKGDAVNKPFFIWNTTSPSVTSKLYYTSTSGEPYTIVNDCSNTYPPTIKGICGPANGAETILKPVDDLCKSGTPSAVSGDNGNPWTWTCSDVNGGQKEFCSAPYLAAKGVCGSDSGKTLTIEPTNLCDKGTSSEVKATEPWAGLATYNWTCTGADGTKTNCSASYTSEYDGVCNPNVDKHELFGPPEIYVECSQGDPSYVSGGSTGPWTWTCRGYYGGKTANCSATLSNCIKTYNEYPTKQTHCPTKPCFVEIASSLLTGIMNDPYSLWTEVIYDPAVYEDVIGPGEYPVVSPWPTQNRDEYTRYSTAGYSTKDYPFLVADARNIDGIAIGPNARLIIYKEKNFGGGTWIDMHGPAVIENMVWFAEANCDNTPTRLPGHGCYPAPDSLLINKWPDMEEFPPKTRSKSTTNMNLWGRGTSAKVICD